MDRFVNEYRYTEDVIEEGVGSWWKWKFKKLTYGVLALMVLLAVLFLLSRNVSYLEFEIVGIIFLVMFQIKKYAGVKNEKKRMHVLHPEEPPLFHVEIVGEEIMIRSKDACRSVSIDTVEGIAETKSLIVLFIQGLMTVTMRKDGFLEGTAEECLSYLKEKTGRK